jgi:predicted O-methyltransferase YrrM
VTGYLQSGAISLFLSAFELQDAFAVTGDVAEIGTFEGKTLLLLAHALNEGERMIGVDRFGLPPGRDEVTRSALDANLSRFGYQDVTDIITGDSQTFTPESFRAHLAGSKVRLFSVDGHHAKASVLHDLALAESVLAPGGIVAADDLFNPWYPGVTEALYDFCRLGR